MKLKKIIKEPKTVERPAKEDKIKGRKKVIVSPILYYDLSFSSRSIIFYFHLTSPNIVYHKIIIKESLDGLVM